ncbi:MAG: hypothetical protein KBT03_04155 [Bacteroidales bacterium]|nr:hypothetical protein [Candidatus Scybalousia scybalohippi]
MYDMNLHAVEGMYYEETDVSASIGTANRVWNLDTNSLQKLADELGDGFIATTFNGEFVASKISSNLVFTNPNVLCNESYPNIGVMFYTVYGNDPNIAATTFMLNYAVISKTTNSVLAYAAFNYNASDIKSLYYANISENIKVIVRHGTKESRYPILFCKGVKGSETINAIICNNSSNYYMTFIDADSGEIVESWTGQTSGTPVTNLLDTIYPLKFSTHSEYSFPNIYKPAFVSSSVARTVTYDGITYLYTGLVASSGSVTYAGFVISNE